MYPYNQVAENSSHNWLAQQRGDVKKEKAITIKETVRTTPSGIVTEIKETKIETKTTK